MKGLLTTLVAVVFYVLTLASQGRGLYCICKRQTWVNSMNACLVQKGTPLPYMRDPSNILPPKIQRIEGNIWTSEYLRSVEIDSKSEELCGFRYLSTPFDKGQVFYGDCNKNRSYICWNSTSLEVKIKEGNHAHAIRTCDVGSIDLLNRIANIFKPGYYWLKNSLIAERVTFYVHCTDEGCELKNNSNGNHLKCGAYSRDAGLYFRGCTDQISSLCHFVNQPDTDVFRTCFEGSPVYIRLFYSEATKPGVSIGYATTDMLVTPENQTSSTTEHKEATTLNDITKSRGYKKESTLIVETTDERMKINSSNRDKGVTDLGLKAGLPIAVCLTILAGIVLFWIVKKRLKQNDNSNTHRDTHTSDVVYMNTNVKSNVYESLGYGNNEENSYSSINLKDIS